MTIEKAYKILNRDREFLGMEWWPYFKFLRGSPGSFSPQVVEAYKRYTGETV